MLTVRTPPTSFSPTNKKVLHCFCTVTSETQICNCEAFTHQQSYGKSRGLILYYVTMLVYWPHLHLLATWINCNICLACRYFFTSSKFMADSNSSFIDVLTRSPTSSIPCGQVVPIRLRYSIHLYVYLPLNSPLPASAVKTGKNHRLRYSGPGLITLGRAIVAINGSTCMAVWPPQQTEG